MCTRRTFEPIPITEPIARGDWTRGIEEFDREPRSSPQSTTTQEEPMTAATSRMIFVNLAVSDLDKTVEFFTKLGFSFDSQFTDEKATCIS